MKVKLPPMDTYLANGELWRCRDNVIPIELAAASNWYATIVKCIACLHRKAAIILVRRNGLRRTRNLRCQACGKKQGRVIDFSLESMP